MQVVVLHEKAEEIAKILGEIYYLAKKNVRDFVIENKGYVQVENTIGLRRFSDVVISSENISARELEDNVKENGKILFDSAKVIKYSFFKKKKVVAYRIDACNDEFKIVGAFIRLFSIPVKYASEVAKKHEKMEELEFGMKHVKRC